jgi:RNA polymerase sigma factor (sigma-70 family)
VSQTRYPPEGFAAETDAELLMHVHRQCNPDALTALMVRHGPMVFGVCHRVLGDHQHAEDAFQETFLVLSRKAGSIARPELLAGWLYGVAYRIAVRSRKRLGRCAFHEMRSDVEDHSAPLTSTDADLRALLDAEMQRLPEKYRLPIVLCYLEGYSNEEAARTLGLPKGTIQSRIARGRDRLRRRLRNRDTLLTGAALAALLLSMKPAGAASPQLVLTTLSKSSPPQPAGARPIAGLSPGKSMLVGKCFLAVALAGAVLAGYVAGSLASRPAKTPTLDPQQAEVRAETVAVGPDAGARFSVSVRPSAPERVVDVPPARVVAQDAKPPEVVAPEPEPVVVKPPESLRLFGFFWALIGNESVQLQAGSGAGIQVQAQGQVQSSTKSSVKTGDTPPAK